MNSNQPVRDFSYLTRPFPKAIVLLMNTGSSLVFYPLMILIFTIMNVIPYRNNPFMINYSTNIVAGESLPKPVNFTSSNLIPAIVFRIFNIDSDDYYGQASPTLFVLLLVLFTVITYVIFLIGISKLQSRIERRFVTLVLAFSPMHQFLALPLDMYDVFIYLGISLIIYGLITKNHFNSFFVGSFLFAFSHPEQALASFAALFLLSLNFSFRFLRKLSVLSLLFTITVNLGVYVWYYSFGYKSARAVEIIFGFFPITLPGHLNNPYVSIETIVKMYGVLWILVFVSLIKMSESKYDRFFFSSSIIGAPFFFWFVTSDGLRCVVPMTTLLSFVLAVTLCSKLKKIVNN